MQVDESVRTYGRTVPLRSTVVYGGVPIDPQIKALRGGVEILVATPGRLLDHVGQKVRQPRPGRDPRPRRGRPDARHGLPAGHPAHPRAAAASSARTCCSRPRSRTTSGACRARSCATRRRSRSRRATPPPRRVRQLVYPVDRDRKEALLAHLIRKDDLRQVLVFTRTKLAASRLASRLDREGLDAVAIHGDRSQPERTRALEAFKRGDIRVLVATDVAARGLDIEDLPVVVNFELPWNPQDYIHRIGRTGRAGADGRGHQPRVHRRGRPPARHPADAPQGHPVDGRGGFVPDRNAEARPLGMRGGHARVDDHASRPPQAGPTTEWRRQSLTAPASDRLRRLTAPVPRPTTAPGK